MNLTFYTLMTLSKILKSSKKVWFSFSASWRS